MKISHNYLLRKIYDQYVLIPVGQAIMEQREILKLNETGYWITQRLYEEITFENLLNDFIEEFEINMNDVSQIEEYLSEFLSELTQKRVLV